MREEKNGMQRRLSDLASAYLPQWNTDLDGGETEAALLSALGVLLGEEQRRLDALPDRREREFLRGFGEGRRGEVPSMAYAALSDPEGRTVPAGTAFFLSGDGRRVWRTEQETWAGPVRLLDHFSTGASGKILPLPLPEDGEEVPLFDLRGPGAERREVRFSHPDAFASKNGCQVTLTLESAALADFLAGDGVSWLLEGSGEPVPVSTVRGGGQALAFDLPAVLDAYALLARVSEGIVPPSEAPGRASVSTVRTGPGALSADLPFGDAPEPWSTCEISCGDALSLPGAEVTLSWTASFRVRTRLLPGMEQEPEYKPVMRSLPPVPPEIKDVWADSVAWEYWNGQDWRPIPGTERYDGWFGPDGPTGRTEVRFRWPEDAHALRWRVRSAEGRGWLPCRDHAPEIADLRASAVLEGSPVLVERAWGLDGGFSPVREREALFPPPEGDADAWWLGFPSPPRRGGTLALYLTFRGRMPGAVLSAWEAGPAGERPLTLEDGTDGLAHDGVLTVSEFLGRTSTRFGKTRWWLCLRTEAGAFSGVYPKLRTISCGAVRLASVGSDRCVPGESVQPLRGGAVSGVTLTESFGGGAEETEAEWVRRMEARRRHLGRAVSEADIEELLRDAFPDVVRARCLRTGQRMDVGVLLRDVRCHDAALALRAEDIRRLLEERSVFPSLGLTVRVRPPVFCPFRLTVWVRPGGEKQALLEALASFLDPVSGNFHGGGWQLGTLPTKDQLLSRLRAAAPETADLSCTVELPGGRAADAAAIRDPFALPLDGGGHTVREVRL